jgi:hypothetical protein
VCASRWWAMTGSNRRQLRCKRSALPTELIAHAMRVWCREWDLNPYEHCCSLAPQTSASANSATSALNDSITGASWLCQTEFCRGAGAGFVACPCADLAGRSSTTPSGVFAYRHVARIWETVASARGERRIPVARATGTSGWGTRIRTSTV